MKVTPTALPEVVVVEPRVFADARGFFMETFNAARYAAAGLPAHFVQDNVSYSSRGVLRGLHLQHPNDQGKLVYVLEGEVFDVAVDLRVGSPTFGRWVGEYLSAESRRQLYIPPGFGHGFVVTSPAALFAYKCTDVYTPEHERTVRWDDPTIGIEWPVSDVTVSPRDAAAPHLSEIDRTLLPAFSP